MKHFCVSWDTSPCVRQCHHATRFAKRSCEAGPVILGTSFGRRSCEAKQLRSCYVKFLRLVGY